MSGYSDFDVPGETSDFGSFVVSDLPGREGFRVVSRPDEFDDSSYAVAVSRGYRRPALTDTERFRNERQRQVYLRRSDYVRSTGFRLLPPGGKVVMPNSWLTVPEALRSMGDACTVEDFCSHYAAFNPGSPARQFHGVTVIPAGDEWMRVTREHARTSREEAEERESGIRSVRRIVGMVLGVAVLFVALVLFLML